MKENQYKTLAELAAAYSSGELTRETAILEVDNDTTYVYWHAADDPDWLRAVKVFSAHPYDLTVQALDLLGIPHEHV